MKYVTSLPAKLHSAIPRLEVLSLLMVKRVLQPANSCASAVHES